MRVTDPDFCNYLKTSGMKLTDHYNIPKVKGIRFKSLDKIDLLGFNYCTNPKTMEDCEKSFIHFFLPDHYIERVWNNLDHYETIFGMYKGIVQPDHSIYTDMPRAMQIWQHYRRNWMAQYFQSKGISVIPAPCWSDEESFNWCFEGMPKGSALCISSVGCVKSPYVRIAFNLGLEETLRQLEPSQLIIYGVCDDDMRNRISGIPYINIESEQKQRTNKFKQNQE